MQSTKYCPITLPRIPGEMDTEERGYIHMKITMEAVFAVLLAGMGGFIAIPEQIFSWDCRIIPQSNSPMPVLPTMQSDDVRQENMATVNTRKESNLPTRTLTIAELQVSMAVYFSANDDL